MSAIPIDWVQILAGTMSLAIGGLFGYFAITMLRKSYKLATKGILTSGVITGHKKVGTFGYFTHSGYSEQIEFHTLKGETISFVSPFFPSYGSNMEMRSRGTKVKVLYDPGNPQDALEASFFQLWFFPLCFLAATLGGVYLSFCVFFGIKPP